MIEDGRIILRLAGLTVSVACRSAVLRGMCADYFHAGATESACTPDVELAVTDADMTAERAAYAAEYPGLSLPHEGHLEALAIHRALCCAVAPRGICLLHSAVVAVDGEAYAFLAPSGVGKTTHVSQWTAHFGERAVIINGDKPFYAFEDDTLWVHGTPWRGREGFGIPGSAPVRALCILERGDENRIVRLSAFEALPGLLRQAFIPPDAGGSAAIMAVLDRILRTVPIYRLECTISREAAELAYRAMSADQPI